MLARRPFYCEAKAMTLFWIFLSLVILVVFGNAMTLLRSATPPKIPEGVKPKPYCEDDED